MTRRRLSSLNFQVRSARVLAGLLLASVAGCPGAVCEQSCTAEGELYDTCLPELGSSWAEMNYDDGLPQYILECRARWDASLTQARSREDSSVDQIYQQCRSREAEALDSTCEDL